MSPNPNPPEKFHSVGLSGRPTEVTLYAGLLVPLTALRCFAHFIVSRDFLAPTGCYIKVCWAGFTFRKVCVKLKVLLSLLSLIGRFIFALAVCACFVIMSCPHTGKEDCWAIWNSGFES